MFKLDQKEVKKTAKNFKKTIPLMQAAVYTMCGGGNIGKFAAEQPEDFYIDNRRRKLPYEIKEIYQAVETLVTIAKANNLDPQNMPAMPHFHNMGIL